MSSYSGSRTPYASWGGSAAGGTLQQLDVSGNTLDGCTLSLVPGNSILLPPVNPNLQLSTVTALVANVTQLLTVAQNMNVLGTLNVALATANTISAGTSNIPDVMTAVHWYMGNFNGFKTTSFTFYKGAQQNPALCVDQHAPLSGDDYAGPVGYLLPPSTELLLTPTGGATISLQNYSLGTQYFPENRVSWIDSGATYILRRIGYT